MKAPLKWLEDYINITHSPVELAEKLTMSGSEVSSIDHVDGDQVFDLEITPNRPDCLSIIGIARELAAQTGQGINLPPIQYNQTGPPVEQSISVSIADPDLCSRYCASLINGIKIAPSPLWIQQRLLACDLRPINNIVDITNYVMLEFGQPLHAFDYQEIGNSEIIVRRAKDGEVFTTLDDIDRSLNNNTLVIADAYRPIALAGIMGGTESEVTGKTTSVLLESANFSRTTIRRTSAQLRLVTEASVRFEKGLNPELALPALQRATQLILELAGGESSQGIIDIYPGRIETEKILLSVTYVNNLLGTDLDVDNVSLILTSLGFHCQRTDQPSQLEVAIPYWRSEVHLPADLAEEVARVIGYQSIPMTMLSSPLPRQQPDTTLAFNEKLRDIMVALGLNEVITYSLTSLEMLGKLTPASMEVNPTPLRVANPLSKDQEYLRTTLRASILTTLSYNQKYEKNGIRLFEIGRIYLSRENNLPEERNMLTALLCGPRLDPSWLHNVEPMDFFDAKGMVEQLMKQLDVDVEFSENNDASLHPGKQAKLSIKKEYIGVIGELHPRVSEAFDLNGTVYLVEIDLTRLLPYTTSLQRFHPLPRFPSAIRDIAVVVDLNLESQKLERAIKNTSLVKETELFDVYTGDKLSADKKSLAYHIIYQSATRTLTDEEVDNAHQEILDGLQREFGATLRR